MSLFVTYKDEELLQLLRGGDQSAFDALYNRYWQSLYNEAGKRLADAQLAEELVQDVFISLWQRRQSLEIENIAAYLFTAIRYKVLNALTRSPLPTFFLEPFETILADQQSPELLLAAKELMELAYSYADTLSGRKKEIYLLYLHNKCSPSEIATQLGISVKTVQNQLSTILQGFRSQAAPLIIIFITHLSGRL